MDKFARRIKLVPIHNSTTFAIADPRSSPHKSTTPFPTSIAHSQTGDEEHFIELDKVAPGMEVPFTIIFRPDTTADYQTQIIAVTERERFLIPIHGLGARACLSLPDKVTFIDAPVNGKKDEVLLVKNIGTADAVFTYVLEGPFTMQPKDRIIAAGQQSQFQITYAPKVTLMDQPPIYVLSDQCKHRNASRITGSLFSPIILASKSRSPC